MMSFRFSRETFIFSGILLLGFAVRFWGVNFGLPYLYHADEPIVVNHALAYGTGDLNPHFFKIPPLISYLLFFCYGIYYLLGCGIGWFHSIRDFENLFYFNPTSFYLMARLVFGVLTGTATVGVFYQLVKKNWGSRAALWGGLLLATSFLHVRDSHYVYTDIPLLFVMICGFSSIFDLTKTPNFFKQLFWIGFWVGLATAVKYNGIFLGVPFLWMLLRSVKSRDWVPSIAMVGFVAFVVFFLLNPFALLDFATFKTELIQQSGSNQGVSFTHHLTYSLAGEMGYGLLALLCLAVLHLLRCRDPRLEAVFAFIVLYYGILWRMGQPYDRYVLPLLPCLYLIMSCFLQSWIGSFSQSRRWIVSFAVLLVILSLLPRSFAFDTIMCRKDVRTIAKEWVESNIPAGSRIALDGAFFMPRLAFSVKQLEAKKLLVGQGQHAGARVRRLEALLSNPDQPFYELYFLSQSLNAAPFLFSEPLVPFDVTVLKKEKIEYVLLIHGAQSSATADFRQGLPTWGEKIADFSPFRSSAPIRDYDAQPLTGGPFLWKDIVARERNGYPISVYRVRSAKSQE